ncbi:guanylin [Tachyglossus aculeatus]|uniref:guanylin n=1 Tax=Tachyglossus aculeatus TaxID=9261 RepID=UPI0018F3EA5F|nr:guanylin [Tachyglossus aculeatus]
MPATVPRPVTASLLLSALCLGLLASSASGVITVREGDFSAPLEVVKKLKILLEEHSGVENAILKAAALCENPGLPAQLKPICHSPNSATMFARLGDIAREPHICELCAYAACTGC